MKLLTLATLVLILAIIDWVNSSCSQINLHRCDCNYPRNGRFYINCQSRGLTSMPETINRSLTDGEASGNFSHNQISSIPDNYFNGMQYFDILDFRSNKITSFSADTLKGLKSSLTHLYMNNNKIKSFDHNTLKEMVRLNTLDLSGNSISSPCGILTADIKYYSLASNSITQLQDNCFSAKSTSSKVIKLDLSHNRISGVGSEAFTGLDLMEELDIGYNSLSEFGGGMLSLIPLQNFQSLSLRGNNFQYLRSICGKTLPKLKLLDLGHNNLVDLQKYCFSSYISATEGSGDLTLNFEHNSIPSLTGSAFAGLHNRLTKLLLNNNQISEVDVTSFNKLNRLISLNLDNNRISSLEFLRNWKDNDLQELYLANNGIRELSPGVFNNLIKLTKLNLDGNHLLYIEANAFVGMSLLNDLSIQYNLMTNLADGAFAGLSQLRKLKLTGNGLVTLKNCTFASLDELDQFHFEDNLLHCDCDLLWLLPYINKVNDYGIAKRVDKPILEDVCHYPLSSAGLMVANEVSGNCRDSHSTTNACVGLEVQYDEPVEGKMNISWSYDTMSSKVDGITITQLDIETNTLVFSDDVTVTPIPVTLTKVEDDRIYKVWDIL